MRFMIDECTGPAVARWLKEQGHNVFSVYEHARGLEDDEVVERAYKENRILITNDKDFGEKVYRDKKPHKGIILLRLDDERTHNKIKVIQQLLENFPCKLKDNFLVVTEQRVRLARK